MLVEGGKQNSLPFLFLLRLSLTMILLITVVEEFGVSTGPEAMEVVGVHPSPESTEALGVSTCPKPTEVSGVSPCPNSTEVSGVFPCPKSSQELSKPGYTWLSESPSTSVVPPVVSCLVDKQSNNKHSPPPLVKLCAAQSVYTVLSHSRQGSAQDTGQMTDKTNCRTPCTVHC